MGFTLYDCGLSLKKEYDLTDSLYIGFVKIAIPLELITWLVLLVFLRLNMYYDEYVDGVVYSVCISMGFSCILCLRYMIEFMEYPFWTFVLQGLVTAFVLIPLNILISAIMGYFVALTKHRDKYMNYVFSILLPVFVSGFMYSMLALTGDSWWYYLLFVIIQTPLTGIIYPQIIHLISLEAKKK